MRFLLSIVTLLFVAVLSISGLARPCSGPYDDVCEDVRPGWTCQNIKEAGLGSIDAWICLPPVRFTVNSVDAFI